MDVIRILLNIVWLIFGGLILAIGYALAGLVACVLIITIPFGLAAFRMANYALWPFGRSVERKESAHCGARNAWRASGSIASITASPMCLEVPLSTPDRIPFIKLTRRRFPAGPKWPI